MLATHACHASTARMPATQARHASTATGDAPLTGQSFGGGQLGVNHIRTDHQTRSDDQTHSGDQTRSDDQTRSGQYHAAHLGALSPGSFEVTRCLG